MSSRQSHPYCLNVGLPPMYIPQPPTNPHQPSPSDLQNCWHQWTYLWVGSPVSYGDWLFVGNVNFNSVEGCVFTQNDAGRYVYKYVYVYLKDIQMYICVAP